MVSHGLGFSFIHVNGLPLTQNSIRIIGIFKAQVEHIEHPNLTKYVECFRNKNERITFVFEDLPSKPPIKFELMRITKQLLDALSYLHREVDCVHGLLTPDCIVWLNDDIKLAHWPIHLLTGGGKALGSHTILPTNISFIAPEQVKTPINHPTKASDLWSAGLILLKLIQPNCKLPENPCRLAFCDSSEQVLEHIESNIETIKGIESDKWKHFFARILCPNPESRANLDELYDILGLEQPQVKKNPLLTPLQPNYFESIQSSITKLSISETYYLWRLSIGRNFESEQKQDDCPPIFKISHLIVSEKKTDTVPDLKLKSHIIVDTSPKPIPLDKFKTDMSQLNRKVFHPLLLTEDIDVTPNQTSNLSLNKQECNNNLKLSESFTFADLDNLSIKSKLQNQIIDSSKILPIVIKEADFAYQCERIVLYKRLLTGSPFLKDQLKQEASIDIPPYFRAQTWAILLDVNPSKSEQLYETIDKTTPVATDRQISVDIPRCHQYNELMASPQGQQKLARILKAWLNYNSAEYVYWQGLDSLAAPFLLLNFDNEAIAFACFNAFVNKYLRGFFRKDNQLIVQQYLSMFSELLSYHDASLASHLEKLGFLPNLYAIPWFLTMFTHVLPLHKILHIWDCLLLGNEKFPLCIGLAILNQLKQELMEFNFNDCIVAFSDLPEIDIEKCIRDASHFYNSTPDKLINLSDIREYQESW